ncbi:2-isopropylmalate synthase [Pelomyxa schiedti]|nr:2-isopropylmalate synthase [Pelomyxa schiedti]
MWSWFFGGSPTPPTPANDVVGYNGETKDGVSHGRGFMRWPGGNTYEGEWHNGKYDGWGVYRGADGSCREGLWRGARFNRGTFYSQNGVDVLDGEWNDTADAHQMQGWGVQRRVADAMGTTAHQHSGKTTRSVDTVYEGEWDRGQWHGCGTWHSPVTGDIYHGQFDHGKRSGYGRILLGDTKLGGGSYVGGWKDDMFHGRGVRIWDDGTRYEGDWVGDKEHGAGTKTWARDGTSIAGVWEKGEIVSGTKRWPNGNEFTGKFRVNGFCGEGMATFLCGGPSSTNTISLVGTFKENIFQETKCGGGRGLCCSIGYGDVQLKARILEGEVQDLEGKVAQEYKEKQEALLKLTHTFETLQKKTECNFQIQCKEFEQLRTMMICECTNKLEEQKKYCEESKHCEVSWNLHNNI